MLLWPLLFYLWLAFLLTLFLQSLTLFPSDILHSLLILKDSLRWSFGTSFFWIWYNSVGWIFWDSLGFFDVFFMVLFHFQEFGNFLNFQESCFGNSWGCSEILKSCLVFLAILTNHFQGFFGTPCDSLFFHCFIAVYRDLLPLSHWVCIIYSFGF